MKKAPLARLLIWILLLQAALTTAILSASFLKVSPQLPPYVPARLQKAASVKEAPPLKARKAPAHEMILAHFSFETPESLKSWEEKIFKGGSVYKVMRENGLGFLKCTSQNASSGLYVKVEEPVTPDLYLLWRWRAVLFPQKKNPELLAAKAEDDFAARVYVIFPGANFFKSDVIEYIWDEKIPAGTAASSAYSERIKLLVVESGKGGGREWRAEERNIYEDYRRLFGKEPSRALGVIALISDSDNTETESEADFTEFILKRKKET